MLLGLLLLLQTPSFADSEKTTGDNENLEVSVKASSISSKHYERISKSIVEVGRENSYGYGTGTIFIKNKQTFVLTVAHVVSGIDEAVIRYENSETVGKVVYYDEDSDIAVISVPPIPGRDPVESRFRKKDLTMGEETMYCGYPNKKELACFSGNISLVSESVINIHSYAWMGASGSAVIDKKGRIVGVLSAVEVGMAWGLPQIIEDIVWVKPINSKFFDALDKGFSK